MNKIVCIVALAVGLSAFSGPLTGPAGADEPPPVTGWMEQFSFKDPPRPAPQTPFLAGNGAEVKLGDFKGRILLVNFWATWCAPCIRELPSLDRLQFALGGEGLLVLAVSQDRGGAEVAAPFLEKLDIHRLGLFLDSKMRLGRALGVRALPWSFLVDREGRIVGELPGYAEWDSDEGIALIRHYLKQGRDDEINKADCFCRPGPPKKLSDN
ncbi:MAG: TlpA family protein disulfide reductase [Alphaproteobacteria bacterium]|nr:TlpA family protein disulfide reductase [Alphaproteobacteria bacterium]